MSGDFLDLELERIEKSQCPPAPNTGTGRLDVERYLADHGIQVSRMKPNGSGTLYCLKACVFDSGHTTNEAAVCQAETGMLTYQCFHESCKAKTWKDARQVISGDTPLQQWRIGDYGNGCASSGRASISGSPDTPPHAADALKPKQLRFEFIHNVELITTLRPMEWRIKDILLDNSLYYNFGDSGSYKTFVELDRMLCIASGLNYHGHPVKQGTVFYVCGEGFQGIGRRIAAWHIAHGTRAQDVPFFVSKTPTELMALERVQTVCAAVEAMVKEYGPPAVVHFDTLARNFGEGDENTTKDMNVVISNLDKAFGNSFCRGLTHHTGHKDKDRARGAYALHCAADIAFKVTLSPSGEVVVECRKMKDAPDSPAMAFERQEIKLLIGDIEDRSYSLRLKSEGGEAAALVKPQTSTSLRGGYAKALDTLRNLYSRYTNNLQKSGRPASDAMVSYSEWRDACQDAGLYKRPDNFKRAVDHIILCGLVKYDNSRVYVHLVDSIGDGEG